MASTKHMNPPDPASMRDHADRLRLIARDEADGFLKAEMFALADHLEDAASDIERAALWLGPACSRLLN